MAVSKDQRSHFGRLYRGDSCGDYCRLWPKLGTQPPKLTYSNAFGDDVTRIRIVLSRSADVMVLVILSRCTGRYP